MAASTRVHFTPAISPFVRPRYSGPEFHCNQQLSYQFPNHIIYHAKLKKHSSPLGQWIPRQPHRAPLPRRAKSNTPILRLVIHDRRLERGRHPIKAKPGISSRELASYLHLLQLDYGPLSVLQDEWKSTAVISRCDELPRPQTI